MSVHPSVVNAFSQTPASRILCRVRVNSIFKIARGRGLEWKGPTREGVSWGMTRGDASDGGVYSIVTSHSTLFIGSCTKSWSTSGSNELVLKSNPKMRLFVTLRQSSQAPGLQIRSQGKRCLGDVGRRWKWKQAIA